VVKKFDGFVWKSFLITMVKIIKIDTHSTKLSQNSFDLTFMECVSFQKKNITEKGKVTT